MLTDEQVLSYEQNGFLLMEAAFSQKEVNVLRSELATIFAYDYAGRILEEDKKTVRGVHGPHLFNAVYQELTRHPRILEPAMQFLHSQVYVHQFKINVKAALNGDIWQWHQDYQYWRDEDGMTEDRAINVGIFLDEVTEFNGPLTFIPRSQQLGTLETVPRDEDKKGWLSTVGAKLKYTFDKDALIPLVEQYGLVAPKGKQGSVLFFHPNILHASTANIAPYDRILLILTYNSVENKLLDVSNKRPEFMAYRKYDPLLPLLDSALFQS